MINFILLMLVLSALMGIVFQSLPIAITIIICAGIIVSTNPKMPRNRYLWCFVIYLLQVCFVLFLYYGYYHKYGVPYFRGGSDDLAFEQVSKVLFEKGKYLLNQISTDDVYEATKGSVAYFNSRGFLVYLIWLRAIFTPLGGYHTLVPRLINMALLLSTALLTERIFCFLSKSKGASTPKWVLPSVALFPNALYISGHVFRDIMSLWFIVISFYLFLQLFSNKDVVIRERLFISIALIVVAIVARPIRNENVYYIASAMAVSLVGGARRSDKPIFKNRRLIGVVVIIGFILVLFAYNAGFLDNIVNKVKRYSDYRQNLSDGLSEHVFNQSIVPFGIFLRTLYALISPIPVHLLHLRGVFTDVDVTVNVLISIGTVLQILMYPFLFRDKRFDEVWLLFWIYLVSIAVATFTFRHFIIIYPFMTIIIARNFRETNKKYRIRGVLSAVCVLLLLAVIYMIVTNKVAVQVN